MTTSNKPGFWRENGDEMIDVKMVAGMCMVSTWHIYKMANSNRMPSPIRIGRVLRWQRRTIALWIKAGCPSKGK